MKKKDLPAMPFYWGDWFKATDVQMLPRDIRCTWFEMLGRMWENEKRGEISVNGIAPTEEELSMLLGFGNDLPECKRHIDLLEKKRIFSRKKNGIIFSRKLIKNEEISIKRSISGTKGMKCRYNKYGNKNITNTESEYENENVIKKENNKPPTKKFDFEPLWKKYPKKIGKKEAFGIFNTTVSTDDDFKSINLALDNYLKNIKINEVPNKYIKDGCNWFDEWEDWSEYIEPEVISEKKKENFNSAELKISIEKQLGRIATDPMIEKCMRGIPEKAWWLVGSFLKRRYPDGGEAAFGRVEANLTREKH